MTTTNTVDAARVELLLSELRLPGIKLRWAKLAEQSDKDGWPAARFLAALAEHEVADRSCRRMERRLAEARLPAGKITATGTLANGIQRQRRLPLAEAARSVAQNSATAVSGAHPSTSRVGSVLQSPQSIEIRLIPQ